MFGIRRRLATLSHLVRPLALAFLGCAILALGIGYVLTHLYRTLVLPEAFCYLTLQFVPQVWRGVFFLVVGVATLSSGIWTLSDKVVIPLDSQPQKRGSAGEMGVYFPIIDVGIIKIAIMIMGAGLAFRGRAICRMH